MATLLLRQRLHMRVHLRIPSISNNPSCSSSSSKSFSTLKLNCGIVGLPNVGKSTLFNALVGSQAAQAANYPFCTIEPNVGLVSVPDSRLDKLGVINNSEKVVPAVIEFVDIAGIVKGASEGAGLGNKFLMVRVFCRLCLGDVTLGCMLLFLPRVVCFLTLHLFPCVLYGAEYPYDRCHCPRGSMFRQR